MPSVKVKDFMMEEINPKQLEKLKKLKGKQIKVTKCDDPYIKVVGKIGNVIYVDDSGTLHTAFKDGNNLGLIWDEDEYEVIK